MSHSDPCRDCGTENVHLGVDHTPECPSVTNLWPFTEYEDEPHGVCCGSCGKKFLVGDVYTVTEVDEGRVFGIDVEVGTMVCLDCAAAPLLDPQSA